MPRLSVPLGLGSHRVELQQHFANVTLQGRHLHLQTPSLAYHRILSSRGPTSFNATPQHGSRLLEEKHMRHLLVPPVCCMNQRELTAEEHQGHKPEATQQLHVIFGLSLCAAR